MPGSRWGVRKRPDKHDRRFSDSDWETNPILKRVLQSYLAAGRTAGELLEGAELSYDTEINQWSSLS